MHNIDDLATRVRAVLTDDLLKPHYRGMKGRRAASAGHCYAASEALYHMLGGKAAGYTPMGIVHEGEPHWWLRCPDGTPLDATADQFETPVPYAAGRGRGFLTKLPSKRAKEIMKRVAGRGVS